MREARYVRTPDGQWFITRPNSSKFPCFVSKEMEIAYQQGIQDTAQAIARYIDGMKNATSNRITWLWEEGTLMERIRKGELPPEL